MRRLSVVLSLLFLVNAALAVEPREPRFADRDAARHVILHANGPLTAEDRAELAAKGIEVQSPMPNGRYIARIAVDAQSDARVTVEPLAAEKKIARSAYREAASGKTWMNVDVIFHEDTTFDDARTAIVSAGGAMDNLFALDFSPTRRLAAKISPAMLIALASDDRVVAVTGPNRFRVRTDNAKSAALSHVTELYSAPYNLTGAGVTVSLFELAQGQESHIEFGGRLHVFATGGSSGDKAHATHVAGTIGAAGLRPEAKGMAPAAQIYQFCVASGSNTCQNDWLDDKDEKLAPLSIVADNNSWGYVLGWAHEDIWVWNDSEEYWGAYDIGLTAPIDDISTKKNVLFVHSAGNDGDNPFLGDFDQHHHVDPVTFETVKDKTYCYSPSGNGTDCDNTLCNGGCETVKHHTQTPFDTTGVTAAGKNTIAVGAVSTTNDVLTITGFSSRGPAKDGRVKPDVVARGHSVLSTVPIDSYATNNGTSMSSPVVTGIAALITEQWRRTFGSSPTPAQLKALIIAGAEDLGNPGPDYTYGFGLVNAKNSVDFIINDAAQGKQIRNLNVAQGDRFEIPVRVTSTQNFRTVLQWADPPILVLPGDDDIAPKALVNDLDLKVIDPNGAEVLPYVLDKVAFTQNATRGVNTVDNTEMVEIANAAPGVYRIIVNGTNLAKGPQKAVLVTNGLAAAPCRDLQEPNDSAAQATGELVTGATVSGAICTQGDVDFFKFTVVKTGAIEVAITAGDTPLHVSLTSSVVNAGIDVPANTTRTLTAIYASGISPTPPLAVTLKVEAVGTIGLAPTYTLTPTFSQPTGPRRRSVR